MATQTWYLNFINTGGGANRLFWDLSQASNIAEAATTSGWVVAKTAALNYALFVNNAAENKGFSTTLAPNNTAPTLSATYTTPVGFDGPLYLNNNCISTLYPYNGYFPAGNWIFTFGFRAVSNGGTQDGRIRLRLYKSGASFTNVTELTTPASAPLIGTTVTNLATGATQFSVVTFAAPIIQLNNEYLHCKLAWEITGQAGSNNADVDFRDGNTCTMESPEFQARTRTVS